MLMIILSLVGFGHAASDLEQLYGLKVDLASKVELGAVAMAHFGAATNVKAMAKSKQCKYFFDDLESKDFKSRLQGDGKIHLKFRSGSITHDRLCYCSEEPGVWDNVTRHIFENTTGIDERLLWGEWHGTASYNGLFGKKQLPGAGVGIFQMNRNLYTDQIGMSLNTRYGRNNGRSNLDLVTNPNPIKLCNFHGKFQALFCNGEKCVPVDIKKLPGGDRPQVRVSAAGMEFDAVYVPMESSGLH